MQSKGGKMKGKNLAINTIIKLINLDNKYNLLSIDFASSLEKEHRRLIRLSERGGK